MRKIRWIFALVMLVMATLACKTLSGGDNVAPTLPARVTQAIQALETSTVEPPTAAPSALESATPEGPTAAAPTAAGGTQKYDTEFPLPADVSNFTAMGNGAVNFQTKTSLKDVIAFYRDAFAKAGYKERTVNTAITDTTFSLVFTGHASGKLIVAQGVDLMNGLTNVNLRFDNP